MPSGYVSAHTALICLNASLRVGAYRAEVGVEICGSDLMRLRSRRRRMTRAYSSEARRLAYEADLALASGSRELAIELVTLAFAACDFESDRRARLRSCGRRRKSVVPLVLH